MEETKSVKQLIQEIENKKEKMPVQLFDLNEFLTIEDMFYKNILLDIQVMSDGNLLLIYSKNGGGP